MMERWIATGQVRIEEVVHNLGLARKTRRAAALLGLERHPSLMDTTLYERHGSARLHTLLSHITYNCELISMYPGLKSQTFRNTDPQIVCQAKGYQVRCLFLCFCIQVMIIDHKNIHSKRR